MSVKWLIMIVAVVGSFMSVLDSTIVNIALATLQNTFHEDVNSIQWVVTGYLLALGLAIPTAGYLADRFGLRPVFAASLIIFTVGSLLCGIATNLQMLIVFRIIQGIGGGGLMPLAMAMVFEAFPAGERGKAMGLMGVPMLLAPAIGPTLGGWLVEDVDWRWIFLVNVPIGVVAVILTWAWLPKGAPHAGTGRKFDVPGIVLSAAGTALVLYSVSEIPTQGFVSVTVLGTGLAGCLLLAVFTLVELKVEDPVLDLRLLRNAAFVSANVANWLVGVSLFSTTFLLPLFLQDVVGKSPIEAGLLLMPQALAAAAMMPVGGRLYDSRGVKVPSGIGLAVLVPSSLALLLIEPGFSPVVLTIILLGRGIGLGLAAMPLNAACLAAAGAGAGARASSLAQVTRQVATSMGIAVTATFVASRVKAHTETGVSGQHAATLGFHDAFALTAAFAVPALVAVFFIVLPKREAAAGKESIALAEV